MMFTKRRVAGAIALACFMLSAPASAGYLGVSLNQNTIKDWQDVCSSLDDGSFNGSESCDDKDNGFRVFGGFGGAGNLSFEIGYSDFGEAAFKGQSDGSGFMGYPPGPVEVTAGTTGIDFGIVGKLPISESAGVLARVGALKWDTDFDVRVTGGSGGDSADGTDFFFGLGLELGSSSGISFRGEYTKYSLDDADLDSLSLSLVFRGGAAK